MLVIIISSLQISTRYFNPHRLPCRSLVTLIGVHILSKGQPCAGYFSFMTLTEVQIFKSFGPKRNHLPFSLTGWEKDTDFPITNLVHVDKKYHRQRKDFPRLLHPENDNHTSEGTWQGHTSRWPSWILSQLLLFTTNPSCHLLKKLYLWESAKYHLSFVCFCFIGQVE